MSITSYSTLKDAVADWLNRSDLTAVIPTFIQLGENKLRRDNRARKLQARTLTVSADDASLPSDYDSIDTLYHDGSLYFGPVEIVSSDKLSELKARYGTSGVPAYAAIIDGVLRFAPVPSSTYSLKMTYWVSLSALSDNAPTNWLLEGHPDIYLYASLLEAAPYLKDDPRVAVWKTELNERLEELHLLTERAQWSGRMRERPRKAIGG